MKKVILPILTILILAGTISSLFASSQGEIDYLLSYGQKILIEGTRRGERKWDYGCRLYHKSNYVAIVQNDGANYRVIPAPRGALVEKICPSGTFQNAIRWHKELQKSRY